MSLQPGSSRAAPACHRPSLLPLPEGQPLPQLTPCVCAAVLCPFLVQLVRVESPLLSMLPISGPQYGEVYGLGADQMLHRVRERGHAAASGYAGRVLAASGYAGRMLAGSISVCWARTRWCTGA